MCVHRTSYLSDGQAHERAESEDAHHKSGGGQNEEGERTAERIGGGAKHDEEEEGEGVRGAQG